MKPSIHMHPVNINAKQLRPRKDQVDGSILIHPDAKCVQCGDNCEAISLREIGEIANKSYRRNGRDTILMSDTREREECKEGE